jgi:streptogramin lyase
MTGQFAIFSVCSAMDQGFGSVWAVSCEFSSPKLVRIDAKSGASIAEIPVSARLPAESSIGAGEGAVWMLTSGSPRQLIAVDPGTNTVARTFPAPEGAVAVRAGLGSVWVSVAAPGQLVRLDPASGKVVATIDVGPSASFLALAPGAVWVITGSDGTVARVDPARNTVTARIRVSSGGISGGDIAATADAVWVRVTKDALAVLINPQTNAVVDRVGPSAGSGGVVIAGASVWITAHDRQSIWRLPR